VLPVALRNGVEIEDPVSVVAGLVEAWQLDSGEPVRPSTFDESDLRLANRGGARISAAEIAAILERRGRIESALRGLDPAASLEGSPASVPWKPLTRLFDSFAEIKGFGYSKLTKTLHRKRPALIPILDSVVQAYLAQDEPQLPVPFGERGTALVRLYKEDLDRNSVPLGELQRELASRGHRLTKVRILDVLIWSAFAPGAS
jgi:hypothetical protein